MKKEGGIQILFRDAFLRDIILNFFETYNFTTDENLPYDQEVSIDPEMLGKVLRTAWRRHSANARALFIRLGKLSITWCATASINTY